MDASLDLSVLLVGGKDKVNKVEKWSLPIAFVVWMLIWSCAYSPTEEALEQRAYDEENWELCKQIYRDNHVPWSSRHSHNKGVHHKHWEIRDDLMYNFCDQVIPRDHWAK
jgi:hypothetical protein